MLSLILFLSRFNISLRLDIMKKRSIIRQLSDRAGGRSQDPTRIIGAKINRRWETLAVDTTCEMDRINLSAFNCIDTECISGRYFISGYNNGLITIHDLTEVLYRKGEHMKTAQLLASSTESSDSLAHTKAVTDVHWYPHDTGMFTSSGMDANLFVWDTQLMRVAEKFRLESSQHKRSGYILSHSISQSCMIAMGGSPPEITIWSIKTGAITHVLKAHEHRVSAVEWSPVCSELLASSGDNGRVYLWDLRQPKQFLFEFDYLNRNPFFKERRAYSCSVVPMLKFLACGSKFLTCGIDGELRIWNALNGRKEQQVFPLVKSSSDFCRRLTLTPYYNQTQIVFVPHDVCIVGFDVSTGEQITSLQGHYNRVNVCQAHSAQQILYSGGRDGDILFWKPKEDIIGGTNIVPLVDNVDDWSESDIDLY